MLDLNGATEFGQFIPVAGLVALLLAFSMRDKTRKTRREAKKTLSRKKVQAK